MDAEWGAILKACREGDNRHRCWLEMMAGYLRKEKKRANKGENF